MKTTSIALLAGIMCCAFVQSVFAVESAKEKVVYSFTKVHGWFPYGGLIAVSGMLNGTTAEGGNDYGNVFAIDPKTGMEKVLYQFNGTDGYEAQASLIDVKGTLYGTTYSGGNGGCDYGCGTVFSLDPNSHVETVLHVFCSQPNCTDGANPYANLVGVNRTLYGTTVHGGTGCSPNGCGTVFAIDSKTGTETTLYAFCSTDCADGAGPYGGLIDVNGKLYGTAFSGGTRSAGTVFAFDPKTNRAKAVYSFCSQPNCADGEYPQASLIDVNGTLYGTSVAGGSNSKGTIFSFDPNTGTETVLHSFCSLRNCADGNDPQASLVNEKGTLYGTTAYGGGPSCNNPSCGDTDCTDMGCGTVFALDLKNGAEKVLHVFEGQDGQNPYSNLIDLKGTLYGTTLKGGAYGEGTVFALTP